MNKLGYLMKELSIAVVVLISFTLHSPLAFSGTV